MSVRRNAVEHKQDRSGTEVQIEVRDLGPIANGTVDLRPLTVFVGPSNTGKTYMSILIYALHQVLGGFLPLPISSRRLRHPYYRSQDSTSRSTRFNEHLSEDDYSQLVRTLDETEKPVMYHDLPVGLRSALKTNLKESGAELELELNRCFDSATLSELVRTSSSETNIKVSLQAPSSANVFWHMDMSLSDDLSTASSDVKDFVLIPEVGRSSRSDEDRSRLDYMVRSWKAPVFNIIEEMANLVSLAKDEVRVRPAGIHYLPAARSGIMQSHRVIASSLVIRSTRAGLEQFPALPSFSGVMADFMQQLIMYRNERGTHPMLAQIANELEQDTLAGLVGLGPSPGGYPEFVYRPHGTEDDVSMTRASSMVSELAPLVLFLRGVIEQGDTLIIEEPEAHLHPAAQTRIAITLGRLVRAGVRVLITTHSDWLLKQIGILIREGDLEDKTGKRSESAPPSSLHPNAVGVWMFRQDGSDQGSTIREIPYDRSEGVEPDEYYNVAEELYDRSADLQNRLEVSRDP